MSDNCAGSTAKKTPYDRPWNGSDAVLVCENEQFHVHSFILGMASPVLQQMFSISKEGKPQDEIPGKYKAIVIIVLDMIYPGEHKIPEKDVIKKVLQIAEEYEIILIKQFIDRYVALPGFELEKLFLAEEFDLELTRKSCIEHLKTNDFVLDGEFAEKVNRRTLSQVILSIVDVLWGTVNTCGYGHQGMPGSCITNNCPIMVRIKGSTFRTIKSWIALYENKQEENK